MGRWHTRLYKTDRARDFDHERDRHIRARQVYETIDRQNFQWIVVLVAGIGFFLDGYTLFASNIALPMISYVYWNNEISHDKLTWINTATLVGTIGGQILFGILADQKGRKKMYGIELVVLIVSTLGVVMASTGEHNSMSIVAWLVFWRFTAGIGVGADYPLSAVITAEFAPTAHRARMMAAVFFMQPLGQAVCNIVSIIVITITRRSVGSEDLVRSVDIMWRWIIGIGVFPAILAMILRMSIPETPRFVLEIEDGPGKADFDTATLFGDINDDSELEGNSWALDTSTSPTHRSIPTLVTTTNITKPQPFYTTEQDISPIPTLTDPDWTRTTTTTHSPTLNSKWSSALQDLHTYFITDLNILTLFATSLTWFLLDFSFYGIALSSPHFLAKTWGTLSIQSHRPPWQTTDDPTVPIYTTFLHTCIYSLTILNVGSLLGSSLLLLFINKLNRTTLQRRGFLFLAALFVTMAIVFSKTTHREGPVAVALYVVVQATFNFGPNATSYILPAELFPTRYRATCHGVSAAVGKLGGVLILVVGKAVAGHRGVGVDVDIGEERERRHVAMLTGFAVAMVLGAVVSLWVPDVQVRSEIEVEGLHDYGDGDVGVGVWQKVKRVVMGRRGGRGRLRSKTLEELSLGRRGDGRSSLNLDLDLNSTLKKLKRAVGKETIRS